MKNNGFKKNYVKHFPTRADREFQKQSYSSTIPHNNINRTESHIKTFAPRIIIMPFPINIHKIIIIIIYYPMYIHIRVQWTVHKMAV